MESIERYKRCLSNEKVSVVGGGIGGLAVAIRMAVSCVSLLKRANN